MRDHLRHLFPPSGLRYELFNDGVKVALVSLLLYVVTKVSSSVETALSQGGWAKVAAPMVWGCVLVVTGVIAVVASYFDSRAVCIAGYVVLSLSTLGWCVILAVGATAGAVNGVPWDDVGKALALAIIYGSVTSNLVRRVFEYEDV